MTDTPTIDEIWAILRQTALQQQATQQQVDSNARAIAANSEAIAETRQAISQLREENRASIEDLVTTLTTYAEQAERDRLALSAEVRSLVNALRDRFGSNGHAGE